MPHGWREVQRGETLTHGLNVLLRGQEQEKDAPAQLTRHTGVDLPCGDGTYRLEGGREWARPEDLLVRRPAWWVRVSDMDEKALRAEHTRLLTGVEQIYTAWNWPVPPYWRKQVDTLSPEALKEHVLRLTRDPGATARHVDTLRKQNGMNTTDTGVHGIKLLILGIELGLLVKPLPPPVDWKAP